MVEPPARWVRAGLAAAGLVVASLVVAIGSTGLREGDRTDPFVAVDAGRLAQLVLVLLAGGGIAAALLALGRRRRRAGRWEIPPPTKPWHVLIVLGLLAVLVMSVSDMRPAGEDGTQVTATVVREEPELIPTPPPVDRSPPGLGLWVIAASGVVAVVVLAASGRRRPAPAPATDPIVPASAEGRGSETAVDPRRRIFAAYQQVEAAAAAFGLHRPGARTVRVHLGILGPLSSAGAAERLSRSYDAARYSPDEPPPALVAEAEQASRRITDGLT